MNQGALPQEPSPGQSQLLSDPVSFHFEGYTQQDKAFIPYSGVHLRPLCPRTACLL